MRFLPLLAGAVFLTAPSHAQISSTAYRALGQLDLRQRGLNMVQGVEFFGPSALTLDARGGQTHLYVSDSGNARVLGWTDTATYQIGDPPAVVLGQPGPQYSNPFGIGTKGFALPGGLAVDPATGNLYVLDTEDNRILRFPSPFSNLSNSTPDAVLGQPDFTTLTAGVSAASLNKPQALAFDSAGDLWVADTGNNRVLRFPSLMLDGRTGPVADIVLGQKSLTAGGANGGGAVSAAVFNGPAGIAFDALNNLYVSDYGNLRVLQFAAPVAAGAAAAYVYGQANMTSVAAAPASNSTFGPPFGLGLSSSGAIYVAVPAENRVLVFTGTNTQASTTFGQSDFNSTSPNASSFPLASAGSLYSPTDVKVDPKGTVYIVDSGNNRVLSYPAGSRSATQVWGQMGFTENGANEIKPGSINTPFKMAIDYSQSPYPLYVSDTNNNRVLIWKDSTRYKSGDPADLVIGQPNLLTAFPNVDTGTAATASATSLSGPRGIALDSSGNLYVADTGNNRVLRYSRPVSQSGRIAPDVVLGQSSYTTSTSGAVSGSSLNSPSAIGIGPAGEVFIADTGNSRVLEFSPNPGTGAAAFRVFGQPNFSSGVLYSAVSPQTLNGPTGVFIDAAYDLYIADTGNNRVLVFPNTQSSSDNGPPAALVFGQPLFNSNSVGGGAYGLHAPEDVALDSSGNIYVSDTGNNRVIIFPSVIFAQQTGTAAVGVVGQPDFGGNTPDWDTPDGLATADSLFGPLGVYVDRQDTLYVGDSGNNRVLQFLRAAVIVNASNLLPSVPVAQGSIATLFSGNIVDQPQGADTSPLPTALSKRQIVVNDSLLSPLFASATGQINFQVPSSAPVGTDRIAVRTSDTGELVAGGSFSVAATAPGLFTSGQSGAGQGVVLNQDGTVNGAANPAARGSVITVFGTGQGQVSPPVPDGVPAPSSPLAYSVTVSATSADQCLNQQSMCIVFGNVLGSVQFSGLAPGWVGLWQIDASVPTDASTGSAVPLKVVIDGIPSNTVSVSIK